jgi:hypothetical protein
MHYASGYRKCKKSVEFFFANSSYKVSSGPDNISHDLPSRRFNARDVTGRGVPMLDDRQGVIELQRRRDSRRWRFAQTRKNSMSSAFRGRQEDSRSLVLLGNGDVFLARKILAKVVHRGGDHENQEPVEVVDLVFVADLDRPYRTDVF